MAEQTPLSSSTKIRVLKMSSRGIRTVFNQWTVSGGLKLLMVAGILDRPNTPLMRYINDETRGALTPYGVAFIFAFCGLYLILSAFRRHKPAALYFFIATTPMLAFAATTLTYTLARPGSSLVIVVMLFGFWFYGLFNAILMAEQEVNEAGKRP